MRSLIVLMLLLVLLAGCSQPATDATPKPDLAAEEKAIRDLDAKWQQLAQARDAAGDAAMYASDGIAYRQHIEPLVGPAAIQAFSTKTYAENPKANFGWTTGTIEVAASGDLAVQRFEYRVTNLGAKGDGEDKGQGVTVWKKVGGEWKVAHDIGATTMPESSGDKKQ